MSEELLNALIKQKLENATAEIVMMVKMYGSATHNKMSARDDAADEAKILPAIKDVVVGTKELKPSVNKSKGFTELVDPALPSVNESDVIDLLPIVFYEQKDVPFEKFLTEFDLGKIIGPDRYITFGAVLGVYEKYSGNSTSFISMTDACEGRDYADGISLHQYDGKLVYSASDLAGIKNNVIDGKYVAYKAIKKPKAARKNAKLTIKDYLLEYADTETIIAEDWTISSLVEDYKKRSGKKACPQSFRNRLNMCAIEKKKNCRIRGKVLADMIEALRNIDVVQPKKKAELPAETKVVVPPQTPSKHDGLTVSLGELYDLSKFVV